MRQFTIQANKAFVDTANAVNSRTIGIFPTSRPAINGEAWFLTANQKQEALRQVYPVTSTSAINHGITVVTLSQFIRCWGNFTDGTNAYGLIFGSSVAIAGQISFYITPTQIVFLIGAGSPAFTSGTVILEWLSQP